MYSELSYLLGWDWYTVWNYGCSQRLYCPVAKKGKEYCFLEAYGCCIYITYQKKVGHVYITSRKPNKCRTHLELDNVKHILLNQGFKIEWHVYQWILEMFTEHYKVYSPYIPDKQEDEYNVNRVKQFSYL